MNDKAREAAWQVVRPLAYVLAVAGYFALCGGINVVMVTLLWGGVERLGGGTVENPLLATAGLGGSWGVVAALILWSRSKSGKHFVVGVAVGLVVAHVVSFLTNQIARGAGFAVEDNPVGGVGYFLGGLIGLGAARAVTGGAVPLESSKRGRGAEMAPVDEIQRKLDEIHREGRGDG